MYLGRLLCVGTHCCVALCQTLEAGCGDTLRSQYDIFNLSCSFLPSVSALTSIAALLPHQLISFQLKLTYRSPVFRSLRLHQVSPDTIKQMQHTKVACVSLVCETLIALHVLPGCRPTPVRKWC